MGSVRKKDAAQQGEQGANAMSKGVEQFDRVQIAGEEEGYSREMFGAGLDGGL